MSVIVDVTDVVWVCGEVSGFSVGALAVAKDASMIKGSLIIRGLKTSEGRTFVHDVIAIVNSCNVGVATTGKMNTDEPVTGLLIENSVPGLMCNLRDVGCTLGGLSGGLVAVAVVW